MSYVKAKDISQYQGDWKDTGEEIVMIKMSGGDNGLYYDSKATENYYGAKSAGRAVGGYHFAGGTDPLKEADFFIRSMSPLEDGDVMALDWEVSHPNPVQWCESFMNEVHTKTGVWPLIYVNLSTLNAFDWTPVLAHCGLWIADWAVSPDAAIPTHHTYVMQQYADGPDYDRDAWFGTVEEFKKYGYVKKVIDIQPPPQPVVPPPISKPIPPPVVPLPGEVVPPTSTPSTPPAPPVATTTTTTTTVAATPVGTVVSVSKSKFSALAPYNKFVVAIVGMVMTYLIQTYTGQPWLEHLVMVLTVLGIYQIKNEPVV